MRKALLAFVVLASAVTLGAMSCGSSRSRTGTGSGSGGSGGGNGGCTGMACYQKDCGAGKPRTSVSGKVTAPNGLDPVYDAIVYVPYAIPEFPSTVECETCNDPIGGPPIVSVHTAVDGTFSLPDVPVTAQVPVIVQKGRFRKITYLTPAECVDTKLTPDQARLPRNQQEGTLPKMAVGVGDFDQIECVLHSIGIDQSEFTDPSGPGAVHLYDNGSPDIFGGGGGATPFTMLLGDSGKLQTYNLVFANCTGNQFSGIPNKTQVAQNLYNYVNAGGRLYVTDWAYDYLEQVKDFAPFIFFEGGGDMTAPQPAHAAATASDASDITATVLDPALVDWLKLASPGQVQNGNQLKIQDLLVDWVLMKSTSSSTMFPSTTWVQGNTNGALRPLTVTFDYNMCGKVLYSSYHTREPGGASSGGIFGGGSFPQYCKSSARDMLPQEKILEYLIFQISACVGPIG